MKMEDFKARFQLFYDDANNLSMLYKDLDNYKEKLAKLSWDSSQFYSAHAQLGEADYQAKIDVFLAFDQYLKQLKKDFINSLTKQTEQRPFFKDASKTQSIKEANCASIQHQQ